MAPVLPSYVNDWPSSNKFRHERSPERPYGVGPNWNRTNFLPCISLGSPKRHTEVLRNVRRENRPNLHNSNMAT